MSLARRSVERPVFTSMVTLVVVVLGIAALVRLQTDLLPPVELPSLSVRTEYEGASPEVVERQVTETVEEILATVPGVEELTSQSSQGNSEVTLRFAWGTDIDSAATEVRAKLEDELSELPENIARPQVRTFDVASFPIVILGVSADMDPVELTTLMDERIAPSLARIAGVAQVDPWGEYERELRVEIDPVRLRAYGLSLEAVHRAVQGASLDLPTGRIESGDQELVLRAPTAITSASALAATVVAERGGALVRLSEVARVRDTHQRLERIVRVNGELGVRLALRKEADANTVDTSAAIGDAIAQLDEELPEARILPVMDQGDFIERSIANVARSILYGGGLAILVLFLFLRSVRSTLVVAVAIPVSLIATFASLYLSGLTLNLMSLGGLALGVGMMVDNAIVVLDNIFRRRQEHGEDAPTAAIEGTREVAGAIVASSLTTIVIFLPLVFVRGVAGVLFRELAYVVAFSLGCSLLVSLSLVPMLAARLLQRATSHAPATLQARYDQGLRGALARPWRVVALCAACLLASIAIVPSLETELFPPSDEGEVEVIGEMPVGTKLSLVDRQTRRLEALVVPRVPEAAATVVSVGASGRRPDDGGRGSINFTLAPRGERARSNEAIAEALRPALEGEVPGMRIRVRAPQGQFLLQRILGGSGGGLEVEVTGPDLAELDRLARRVSEVAEGVRGVTDVERTREATAPQVDLWTDRDAAADLGLDPAAIARALEIAVAGRQAGEYRVGSRAYRILVQLEDAHERRLEEILDLGVESPTGGLVPLRQLVTPAHVQGPTVIDRASQRRIVRVRPNVGERPLGSVAAELEEALSQVPTPPGYALEVAGSYEEQQEASRELGLALLLALVLVYMVLAAQYESLRDPWVVMLSVPMAATGVFVALALTGTTLNVQSYVGCIVLGGIVVNNAVLLVDQASQLRRRGATLREALREAGRRRLRPILMTTSTTALALVPLALGIGEGADAQAPLARAVLGGLVGSTIFTLVLIPAAYLLLHRREERAR